MKQLLGILLMTSPEYENTYTVIRLTESAVASGKDVEIFLMGDGVYNINSEEFTALFGMGAKLTLCSHNASERSLTEREGINFGSLYDLAYIVNRADRFLTFN